MKNKSAVVLDLTAVETQLIEDLRQHPEMRDRVQAVLAIVRNDEGPLKKADEVEELLIEQMRRLGNTSMCQWAGQAEERVSKELKQENPAVRSRKKKR